jgi:bile acid:Na+ symporter, BASS family
MQSSSYLFSIAIALVMLVIGLSIRFQDFKRVYTQPKALISGLVLQMLVLPAVAFIIALIWPLKPVHQMGLVLIAACPGGTTSNLLSYLLKGRVALSVSLTSFNSFLILFTIPTILNLAGSFFKVSSSEVSLSLWETLRTLLVTVIIPVSIGILINQYFRKLADKLQQIIRILLVAGLVTGLAYFVFQSANGNNWFSSFQWLIFWPALALNISTIFIGWITGRFIGISKTGSYTIAIEMGLQNSALAIFIAGELIGNSSMTLVATLYGGFSFVSTAIFILIIKKLADVPGTALPVGK